MFIVDRFEGDWAVIEYERKTFNLPRFLLPQDCREGDVILIDISVDQTLTAKRKQIAAEKLQGFFDSQT